MTGRTYLSGLFPSKIRLRRRFLFLKQYPDQSGIIYCFSRKQVENLSESLETMGFSVRPYHAGLTDEERKKNQELFIRDDVLIIVATIAFGMGINKPNVRFVLHFDLPKSIESYYQEIGRAGRDGLRAECLLLFNYADIQKIKHFINQKQGHEKRVANIHLQALLKFAETEVCRRIPLLDYFGEAYSKKECGMCDNCLSDKKDQIDITVYAQKFLSCVKRTGEIFGAAHIIDVLRGSEAKKSAEVRPPKSINLRDWRRSFKKTVVSSVPPVSPSRAHGSGHGVWWVETYAKVMECFYRH